jgi:hypothetical protein
MATNKVAEVGGEERAFANGRWNGKQYELSEARLYVYIGTLELLRQDTP